MSDTSNYEQMRQQMFDKAKMLGETEGRGSVSRAAFAINMVEWAKDGLANVDDAETLYDTYMGSNANMASTFGGLKKAKDEQTGRKQNVSKFRQFIKLGVNKKFDPVPVIYDAQRLVKDERAKGTIVVAPFDAMLNIVRMQNRGEYCEEPLSHDQMLYANMPKERDDKVEADLLDQQKRKLEKIGETYMSPQLEEAIEELASRIAELGGTTKQQKDRERAEAQERKKRERAARAAA